MNILRYLKTKLVSNQDIVSNEAEEQKTQANKAETTKIESLFDRDSQNKETKTTILHQKDVMLNESQTAKNLITNDTPDQVTAFEENKQENEIYPLQEERSRYQLRQIRRQIRDEFLLLLKQGNDCEPMEIVRFLSKFSKEQELMYQALSQYKPYKSFPSVMIWKYLDGSSPEELLNKVNEQQIFEDFKTSVESRIPNPIIFLVKIDEQGPQLDAVTSKSVVEHILKLLSDINPDLKLDNDLKISGIGNYQIRIAFAQGFSLQRTLQLKLEQIEIPSDLLEELRNTQVLELNNKVNKLAHLQEYLGSIKKEENILEYQLRLGRVLLTAYYEGYLKNPAIQHLLADWRNNRDTFFLSLPSDGKKENHIGLFLFPHLSQLSITPEARIQYHKNIDLIKQELQQTELKMSGIDRVPAKLDVLIAEVNQYYARSNNERAKRFISLSKAYEKTGTETTDLLCYSLAHYCKAMGSDFEENGDNKKAQYYYQPMIFLYGQMYNSLLSNHREKIEGEYRHALATYFRIHKLDMRLDNTSPEEVRHEFYEKLFEVLNRKLLGIRNQSLGYCILDFAIADELFIYDLINRLKQKQKQWPRALKSMASSLSIGEVFLREPELCLRLLGRIEPTEVGEALRKQSMRNPHERRLVGNALLRFANTYKGAPEEYLQIFERQGSLKNKKDLVFSILVEPFILNSDKESLLKAQLIATILGLLTGTRSYNFFIDKVSWLADEYNKFTSSTDPNIKGRYGYNILNTIRLSRKILIKDLTREKTELILQFFRSIHDFVTSEQDKLIRNTILEVDLITERVLHSRQETRLTLEIRNVGAGLAENIRIHINQVVGQYQVEDRYRKYELSILRDRDLQQQDIFIQPLVEPNQYITLDARVEYDTREEQDQVVFIPTKNRQVLLYPSTQFIRIPQPYNIGDPATTWFYGRQEMLKSMADNLRPYDDKDVSMIVYGLKRAGKTSVVLRFAQNMLKERDLEKHYLWVYANLEKEPLSKQIKSNADFLFLLLTVILRALPNNDRSKVDSEYLNSEFAVNPFERFDYILNDTLKIIYPRKLLIILDEFSYLNQFFKEPLERRTISEHVFSFLSNVIQHTNQLTFIFTGTYVLSGMMREYTSDLAKICTPTLVSFLDESSARRLIKEPVQQDEHDSSKGWLEYDNRVIERIIDITACHPYLIQYLCMQLVKRMNAIRYSIVNLKDLDSVLNEIISRPEHEPIILTLWKEFDVPQHKLLSIIAEHSEPETGIDFAEVLRIYKNSDDITPPENIHDVCVSLVDADLIERTAMGDATFYRIKIPIYEMWIKNNRTVKTVFGK